MMGKIKHTNLSFEIPGSRANVGNLPLGDTELVIFKPATPSIEDPQSSDTPEHGSCGETTAGLEDFQQL